jgi:hypothetical protein
LPSGSSGATQWRNRRRPPTRLPLGLDQVGTDVVDGLIAQHHVAHRRDSSCLAVALVDLDRP